MAPRRLTSLQVILAIIFIYSSTALGQDIAFVPWQDDFTMLAGESYVIEWTGGTAQDVVISLVAYTDADHIIDVIFHGPPVPSNFSWVPPSTLDPQTLYVLQLNQGITEVESPTFLVEGGQAAATTSSSTVSPVYPSYTSTPAPTPSTTTAPTTAISSNSRTLLSSPVSNMAPTSAFASSPTTSSSSPTPAPRILGPGAIAGIVIGSIGALALISICSILIIRLRRSKSASSEGVENSTRRSNMSELSGGWKANRHEVGVSHILDGIGNREDVRISGVSTLKPAETLQELPVDR